MAKTRTPKHRAVATSMIELLVVVAIVSMLLALLLPAIQNTREAARGRTCGSHLRQLGQSITQFEASTKRLPFGRNTTNPLGISWAFAVLPYLEQNGQFEQYNDEYRVDAVENRLAMSTPVPVMFCPTRRSPDATRDFDNNNDIPLARGVAAAGDFAAAAGPDSRYGVNLDGKPFDPNVAGPMFTWSKVRIRQVADGLSRTVSIGERHIPLPEMVSDPERLHVLQGDTAFYAGDNYRTVLSGYEHGIAFSRDDPWPEKFGSEHSNVCQFVFLDGHVISANRQMDRAVLRHLCAIADGAIPTNE